MALQKQSVTINFSSGLDTKSDPFQLPVGKFESLQNSVFDKLGRLTKRNGFGFLTSLPDNTYSYLTTFNGNLTAIGNRLQAYASGPATWVNKGQIQPLQVSTLPLIRNNTNQSYVDTSISYNGLICTVYTDNIPSGSTTLGIQKYAVADSITGQNVIAPTSIVSTFGTVSAAAKVFSLGYNFIVVFPAYDGANQKLQYFPISQSVPGTIGSVTDISTSITISSTGAFDGVVASNNLVLSWNGSANSGLKSAYLTRSLTQSSTITIATSSATIVSVCADISSGSPIIWSSIYSASSSAGFVVATTLTAGSGSGVSISTLFAAKRFVSSSVSAVFNLASIAQGGSLNLAFEVSCSYSYSTNIQSNFIDTISCTQTGSLSAFATLVRSVGLASKGFLIGSTNYFLSTYSSPYQPTYFLIGSGGAIAAKLAYGNAGGYLTSGLPSVSITSSTTAQFGYLFKDLVQAVNKDTNVSAGTQTNGIYAQLGVNLATVKFGTSGLATAETGSNLNINGGYLWGYDGYQPVEQGFHLFPDSVVCSVSASPGQMTAQQYYYQSTYEWADNQGNLFRSAPSIPVTVTVSSGFSQVLVNVPTLRMTNKISNPVKIVLYRWSAAQQVYYQVTSITSPVLNNTTIDSIAYTDYSSDSTILGNNIIYTNGAVAENTGGPPATGMTLFDSRLWLIDAEDQNLLWFSKQVIEAAPVEMSDLFTLFVPPSSAAQGPTGPMRCLAPMDDKLIIFKKNNAIYYINGAGPDNTGANNQYSQPTFITGTVGCSNQNSIVMTPNGLMFQADNKGIWLLGRDLSTSYIGKDVEAYNGYTVLSSLVVPGTNQVRFTLSNGVTLMFDYFVNQWGTFNGIPGISSTLYQNLHSFINQYGQSLQETVGSYLDGTNPVLMSFRTGWLNLAGLQGYQRVYRMYLLGQYQTPHKLTVGVAYDYDSSVDQLSTISPTNYSAPWGSDATWGQGEVWGGSTQREQWQINFEQQTCQSFQLSLNEYFDGSIGAASGAGLTISGMNLVAGIVKSYPRNVSKTQTV